MKARISVLAGSLLLTLGTAADVHGQNIHPRLENLERRVDQGVRSKELTPTEADRLRNQLRDVREREQRMRADGKLGPRERKELDAELDRLSRRIVKQKHDEQKPRR